MRRQQINSLATNADVAETQVHAGITVGEHAADPLVEGAVVVEPKAVKALDRVHTAQSINYLKATGLRVCPLLNFGKPRLEIQRAAN